MIQIAIDGPSGAGKSSAAKKLAKRLGINYLDTGATYRSVALALIRGGVDYMDSAAVVSALPTLDIEIRYTKGVQRMLVNGEDVTESLRTPEVSNAASKSAVIPEVRLKLVELQREVAEKYDIIMDGRDIGTYVLPGAPVKFYITASSRVRAERRAKELAAAGIEKPIEELEKEMIERDKTDSSREFAPLRRAEDACYIDNSEMTREEVQEAMLARIKEVYPNAV